MTALPATKPVQPVTAAPNPLEVPEADARTVRSWLEAGEIVLVDVRETSEYEQENIPGSVLCPLSMFDPDLFPRIPEKMVVLHCAIGKRSAAAAKQLLETGHTRIVNLQGGIKAWKESGGPTETQIIIPEEPKKLPILKKIGPCGPEGLLTALPESDTPRPIGIHPGRILLEEFLKPQNFSRTALARELKVSASRINAIVMGRAPITADTALRLSRYFCTTEEFWLHLQVAHDLEKARRTSGRKIIKEVRVRKANT